MPFAGLAPSLTLFAALAVIGNPPNAERLPVKVPGFFSCFSYALPFCSRPVRKCCGILRFHTIITTFLHDSSINLVTIISIVS